MTNLTKQEIQDARERIEVLELIRHFDTELDEVFELALKTLDIAEKQVWLPISDIPKKANLFTDKLEPSGLYQLKGILSHQEVYALAHMVEGDWFYPCYVRCIDDDTEMEGSYLLGFEPTHYMPLPLPPHV